MKHSKQLIFYLLQIKNTMEPAQSWYTKLILSMKQTLASNINITGGRVEKSWQRWQQDDGTFSHSRHFSEHSVPNPVCRESILCSSLEHDTITGYLSSVLLKETVTESSENVPETLFI